MWTAGSVPLVAQQGRRPPAARGYSYVDLDVFTDRKLAGNPLLAYVNPEGLDAEAMTHLTIESNYTENTFVFAPEQPGTDVRVRIFTRAGEVPFAGHPTIGTAFALAHVGRLKPGTTKTVFGLGVGPTPIDLQWNGDMLALASMTQLKPTFGKQVSDAAAIAASIGLEPGDIADLNGSPAAQDVNTGSSVIIVPVASRKAVDAAVLDRARWTPSERPRV
jgi:trans-2,3-dihydro-3-hydroxyanthranilate isomerase